MRAEHIIDEVKNHKHRLVRIKMNNYWDAFSLTLITMMIT